MMKVAHTYRVTVLVNGRTKVKVKGLVAMMTLLPVYVFDYTIAWGLPTYGVRESQRVRLTDDCDLTADSILPPGHLRAMGLSVYHQSAADCHWTGDFRLADHPYVRQVRKGKGIVRKGKGIA